MNNFFASIFTAFILFIASLSILGKALLNEFKNSEVKTVKENKND